MKPTLQRKALLLLAALGKVDVKIATILSGNNNIDVCTLLAILNKQISKSE